MDDTTRQLLRDAAPPVPTGTDFDHLWHEARRQRRRDRIGQAVAAAVLLVVAGLALPLADAGSLPLLGGDIVEVETELVSAPLSEWDVVGIGPGGSVLGASSQHYRLSVFAIEGDRWCIAGQPGGADDFDFGPLDPELAARLMCHEAKRPGRDPIGTFGAIRIGDRIVHWATLPPSMGRTALSADFGNGMRPIESSQLVGGGGAPFALWIADTTGRTAVRFEVPDPTGQGEPLQLEAPEPVPAEVGD